MLDDRSHLAKQRAASEPFSLPGTSAWNWRGTTLGQLIGALLATLGLAVVVRWIFQIQWIADFLPGSAEMGINAPVMFVATGICFICLDAGQGRSHAVRRLGLLCSVFLMVLAGLILSQHLFGWNLGLDFVRFPTEPTALNPHPGRVSANACLGFLATGYACSLLLSSERAALKPRLSIAIGVVALIGFAGLTGYLLGLERLYRLANQNRLLPISAVGLCLISAALWLIRDRLTDWDQRSLHLHEKHITRRAVAVSSLIAVFAGVGGFAVLRQTFEASVADGALLTARTNAASLTNSLDMALLLPRLIASRPAIADALEKLGKTPTDEALRGFFGKVAQSFLMGGVNGVEFFDAQGQRIALAGTLIDGPRSSAYQLPVTGQKTLLRWSAGYILDSENLIYLGDRLVGSVKTEQRMPLFDKVLEAIRGSSDTSDALLCTRVQDDAVCEPTRFYAEQFKIPMFTESGALNLPINKALAGETGVTIVRDLRDVEVVAAYVPLPAYGLGFVVKSDVSTSYAPLRQRLQLLGGLLLTLIAMGTAVLRMRVRPLLTQVLDEQQRTQVILDNSNDAFVALNVDGTVSDWNAQAALTFGWPASEAIGRKLDELIIPEAQRQAHREGFARFKLTGQGPVINRRVELVATHRDGHEIPIELSVAAIRNADGYVATAFARDITQRKAAERRIADSERRLRDVTNNLPALVSQFDRDGKIVFANTHCAKVYGGSPESLLGKTVRDVRGDEGHQQLQPYVDRALSGESVEFESHSSLSGSVRYFHQSYVPDVAHDGAVQGFYAVSFDITERKGFEHRIAASEKRLRDIADNLPVLISYIDKDERLTFLNATFGAWLGVDPDGILGHRLDASIPAVFYEQRRDHLNRALAGERVSFSAESESLGISRHLQNEYIPDVGDDGEVAGVYALSTDVTDLKMAERRLSELAHFDTLTGLPNRHQFNQRLQEALARSNRSGLAMALFFLDVDRFKSINDTLGHGTGDEVLKEFADRLRASVRLTDTVARLAGDEFVIILESLKAEAECEPIAMKIIAMMREPFNVSGRQLAVSTSIGVAFHEPCSIPAAELLEHADRALYAAKAAGRNTYVVVRSDESNADPHHSAESA